MQRRKLAPFLHAYELVDRDIAQLIDGSAWPANFDQVYARPFSKTKVYAQITLRNITATAADFINLRERSGDASQPGADRTSIGSDADQLDVDPVIAILPRHLEERWSRILIVDDHIDTAVIVEITKRAAAACRGRRDRGAGKLRNLFEFAVAAISVEYARLPVRGIAMDAL